MFWLIFCFLLGFLFGFAIKRFNSNFCVYGWEHVIILAK